MDNSYHQIKEYNGEKAAQRLEHLGLLSPRVVGIMRYAGHFSSQEPIPNEIIAYLQSLDKTPLQSLDKTPKGYCLMNDQIIRYHKERNNVYFGADFYAKNGVIYPIKKDNQIICEDVILDPKEKQIINPAYLSFGRCLAEELFHVKKCQVNHENGITTVQTDNADFLKIKEGRLIEAKLRHVTEIGENAFLGCSSLTSVDIPKGVKIIRGWAFSGCSSLKEVVVPKGVERIGDMAFSGCSSLTSVDIPKGVTDIGESAFYGCSSLKEVVIPEGVKTIGEDVFRDCSSLTNVVIPEGVKEIGNWAFCGCSSLTSVNIPESVERIGDCAFYSCSSNLVITCATDEQKELVENSGFKGEIRIQPQRVAEQSKLRSAQQTRSL